MTNKHHDMVLRRAIKRAGNQTRLAEHFGVSRQFVSKLKRYGLNPYWFNVLSEYAPPRRRGSKQ